MDPLAKKRISYVLLSGSFVLGLATFALLHSQTQITPLLIAELAFAVYRLGRMVSFDKVFETYRLPFVKTIPDPTGAGDTTAARGHGLRQAIGELICCPICAGTWVAAVLVVGLNVLPTVSSLFITIFAVIGLAELLNSATEYLEWNGQMAREYAGTIALAKKQALSEVEDTTPSYIQKMPLYVERYRGNGRRIPADGAGNGEQPTLPRAAA
ncbi:MAG: DUF1360 domain-containing protein, partial [Rudaea sp.]